MTTSSILTRRGLRGLRFVLCLGTLASVLCASPMAAAEPAPQALWNTNLPDATGHSQALSHYRGHPLVINFWASWCDPCVEEMPALSKLQAQNARKGVQFIGIGIDSASNIDAFLKRVKVAYPVYVAGFGGADLARAFGNSAGGLPYTVIVDSHGEVRYSRLGRVDPVALQHELDGL